MSERIRLDLSYLGSAFFGWQIQPEQVTVQGELQSALEKLYQQPIKCFGAGRTDSGVHARQQVAHFEPPFAMDLTQLQQALNGMTPKPLLILAASHVPEEFHARFSPHEKTYAYRFQMSSWADPLAGEQWLHIGARDPDVGAMKQMASLFKGCHDFASFCSSMNATDTTTRTLLSSELIEDGPDRFIYQVRGKGFLHHMVRILAGCISEAGKKKLDPAQVEAVLGKAGMRDKLGPTLPATGLTLEKIFYPDFDETHV